MPFHFGAGWKSKLFLQPNTYAIEKMLQNVLAFSLGVLLAFYPLLNISYLSKKKARIENQSGLLVLMHYTHNFCLLNRAVNDDGVIIQSVI